MRPTQAVINLSAIRHNVRQIRSTLAPDTRFIAVVKANAYGHGVIPVSRTLLGAGADWLAVALPEEGAELRSAGFRVPILVLGLLFPEQLPTAIDHELTVTVSSLDTLNAFNAIALAKKSRIRVMVKIDTGMGRIGVLPEAAAEIVRLGSTLPGIEVAGTFTHFAAADEPDSSFSLFQLAKLEETLGTLRKQQILPPVVSAANSAATLTLRDAHFNAVRPGIILYGLPPASGMSLPVDLQPAMSLKTRIVHIKQVPADTPVSYGCTYRTTERTWLATLPLGYADGYSRHLSSRAPVLVRGIRRQAVGRICMDQTVIDLGPDCNAEIGDEAVLFGRQGDAEITLTELADLAGTINYELACGISPRVPRIYVE